jgi:CheY-like chemotaxis protein
MAAQMGEPRTVLIADDDRWLRWVLAELLADRGLRPLEAESGPETVRLAREHRPDAIVLDVALPGKSGLQVLDDLRAEEATHDIPVVLVSGRVNLIESGHAHDTERVLHKPLDVSALLSSLDSITAQ